MSWNYVVVCLRGREEERKGWRQPSEIGACRHKQPGVRLDAVDTTEHNRTRRNSDIPKATTSPQTVIMKHVNEFSDHHQKARGCVREGGRTSALGPIQDLLYSDLHHPLRLPLPQSCARVHKFKSSTG